MFCGNTLKTSLFTCVFPRKGLVQLWVCFSPVVQPDVRQQPAGLFETRKQVSAFFNLRLSTFYTPRLTDDGFWSDMTFYNHTIFQFFLLIKKWILVCRAFFLALYKHMMFLEKRGCPRTALEYCKLILRYQAKSLTVTHYREKSKSTQSIFY